MIWIVAVASSMVGGVVGITAIAVIIVSSGHLE